VRAWERERVRDRGSLWERECVKEGVWMKEGLCVWVCVFLCFCVCVCVLCVWLCMRACVYVIEWDLDGKWKIEIGTDTKMTHIHMRTHKHKHTQTCRVIKKIKKYREKETKKWNVEIKIIFGQSVNLLTIWGQFHQHFTRSFYACRYHKRKKDPWLDCISCAFGI